MNNIQKLIDRHEIISFDIFDTLLTRPYMNPYHLMRHIEKCMNIPGFYNARMLAEHTARQKTSREDITLDEIYENIDAQFQNLKDTELDYEYRVLRPRKDIHDLYEYAVKHGKKIAILSDMYLPRVFLISVLKKCGYQKYDWLYVSGDVGVAKHTGNMYRKFLTDCGIKPDKILHIGDSEISDVKMPRANGISAVRVPRISELFLSSPQNRRFRELYELNPDSLEISIILMQLARYYVNKHNFLIAPNTYWHDFGYAIGGPIAYGFCKYIQSVAHKNNLQQLLFIARDGYSLHRVFDLISANSDIKSFYVYAQRILRAKCMLEYGDEHNADVLVEMLRALNIRIPEFTNCVTKQKFISDNLHLLRDSAVMHMNEYKQYLADCGVDFSLPTMVVDSGAATFSAQRLISATAGHAIDGIYTIITRPEYARENNIKYNVWSKCPGDIDNITSVIEFILMAPQAPITDVVNGAPVYQDNPHPAELMRNKIAPEISNGIVEFVSDIVNALDGLTPEFNPINVNEYVRKYLCNLSDTDIKMLGMVRCASNASHTEYNQRLLDMIYEYSRTKRSVYLLCFKIFTQIKYTDSIKIYIGNKIPFINAQMRGNKKIYKLFNIIPLITVKDKGTHRCYDLFGILRIIRVKNTK